MDALTAAMFSGIQHSLLLARRSLRLGASVGPIAAGRVQPVKPINPDDSGYS